MQLERLLVGHMVGAVIGGRAARLLVHRPISPPLLLQTYGVPWRSVIWI
jgi:hypothetical protein